ncbi:DUF481 domain-containing protein [Ruegeria arenilitoris]|uniref:DUF481 domain-containing protein n=1 Tax=Ruegeria arenilitoris TaxID=1173585 RepID=UPI0014802E80
MNFLEPKNLPQLTLSTLAAATLTASTAAAEEDWQWGAQLYFWGASVGGETTTGGNVDISIDKIIEDLNFGVMGTLVARNDRLSLIADVIYLDVDESDSTSVDLGGASVPVTADIGLKGFITTLGAGYRVLETSGGSLDITGGARALYLDGDVSVSGLGSPIAESESGTNWDAVIGFRGETNINEDWYFSYYADIGTGDSDLTWQAAAAINYRLNSVDLTVGYRYLDWDLGEFGPFNEVTLSGAFLGVRVPF